MCWVVDTTQEPIAQPTSAAALSVCSPSLSKKLGNIYILEARKEEESHLYIVALLAKELPDRIFRCSCKCYHTVDAAQRYLYFEQGRPMSERENPHTHHYKNIGPCVAADLTAGICFTVHADFSQVIFDFITKRVRLGLDCSESLQLLKVTRTQVESNYSWESIADACVIASSLFVRVQYIVRMPQTNDWPQDRIFLVCRHAGTLGMAQNWESRKLMPVRHGKAMKQLRYGFRQWERDGSNKSELKQCSVCRTEYSIGVRVKRTGLLCLL